MVCRNGLVRIVHVAGNFWRGAGVDDVSWVKLQMSMSSIFSMELTSKISSITFVMVEGS